MARSTVKQTFSMGDLERIAPPALLERGSAKPRLPWRKVVSHWLDAARDAPGVRKGALAKKHRDFLRQAELAMYWVDDDVRYSGSVQARAMRFVSRVVARPELHPEHRIMRPVFSQQRWLEFLGTTTYRAARNGLTKAQLKKAGELCKRLVELHNERVQVLADLLELVTGAQSEVVQAGILAGGDKRSEAAFIWYMREILDVPAIVVAAMLGRLSRGGRFVDPRNPLAREKCHTLNQSSYQIDKEIRKASQI